MCFTIRIDIKFVLSIGDDLRLFSLVTLWLPCVEVWSDRRCTDTDKERFQLDFQAEGDMNEPSPHRNERDSEDIQEWNWSIIFSGPHSTKTPKRAWPGVELGWVTHLWSFLRVHVSENKTRQERPACVGLSVRKPSRYRYLVRLSPTKCQDRYFISLFIKNNHIKFIENFFL